MRKLIAVSGIVGALFFAGSGVAAADDDMTHDQPVASSTSDPGMTHDGCRCMTHDMTHD
jgi:hypothetical protein